jgi:hypothetical protein
MEKKRADERRAAEERQRQADTRSEELENNLAGMERSRADERRAAAEQERRAEVQRQQRQYSCNHNCYVRNLDCETKCIQLPSGAAENQCKDTCKQYDALCKNGCE